MSHVITIKYTSLQAFECEEKPAPLGQRSITLDNATYQKVLDGEVIFVDGKGPPKSNGYPRIERWCFNDPKKGWVGFYWQDNENDDPEAYEPLALWHDENPVALPSYW